MKNKGFSLITLCVTIIVILIISTITILNVNSTDILNKRVELEFKNDMKNFDVEIKSKTFSKEEEFPTYAIYKKADVEKYSDSLSQSVYITDDFETTVAYIYQGVLTLRGKNITDEQRKWAREARIKIDDEGIIPKDNTVEIALSSTSCTNEDVVLNFSYNGVIPDGYKIQYKVGENGTWKYGNFVTIKENTTVFVRLYNDVTLIEGVAFLAMDITNIDKTAPTLPSISVVDVSNSAVTYKAQGSTDDDGIYCICKDKTVCGDDSNCTSSGNSVGYQYSNNSYNWSKTYGVNDNYTINTDNKDVVYLYARAVDCSNNASSVSSLRLYKIKYDVNGGNASNKPNNEYKIENKNYTVSSVAQERTGYIFNGWKDEKDNKIYASGGNFSTNHTTTLKANWTAKTINVAFMRNINSSDTTSATQTFTYGVQGQSFSEKGWKKEGYTLLGWSTDRNATVAMHPVTSGVADYWIDLNYPAISLYGVWQANKYSVTLDGNGGLPPNANTMTVTYDVTYGSFLNNSATRDGYIFVGWYTARTGGTRITSDTKVKITSDTILYAHWEAKNINVTFMRNINSSDTTSATQIFTYGVQGQSFSEKGWTKEGYTLLGWSTDRNATVAMHPVTSGVGDYWIDLNYPAISLYGVWQANTYTVVYDGNGATSGGMASSVHTYNVAGNLTANGYAKTGYTFVGWNTNSAGTGTTYSNSQSVANLTNVNGGVVTLYAIWQPNTYTVVYNGNGATSGGTTSSVHTYDVAGNLTANGYAKTGYTFVGWNTKADGTGTTYSNSQSVANLTSVNGGVVTLYAQWVHFHTSACYHTHTSSCYQNVYHSHVSSCYHSHSSSCEHIHGDSCYKNGDSGNPICGLSESNYICGLSRSSLICGMSTSTIIGTTFVCNISTQTPICGY